MKTKTLSYLRVSGKGQIDGDGFPRQRESVTNYARRNRMEIVNEFRDEGVTGTLFDRPGLTELFLTLKAGDVKVVLVEKADRLARDLIVSETLLAEFRKLGVKVVAAEGGTDLTVDNDDPSRKMIRLFRFTVFWEKTILIIKEVDGWIGGGMVIAARIGTRRRREPFSRRSRLRTGRPLRGDRVGGADAFGANAGRV